MEPTAVVIAEVSEGEAPLVASQASIPTAVPVAKGGQCDDPEHRCAECSGDAALAARLQAEELGEARTMVVVAPRAPDLVFVESYYGPRSMLASVLLFFIFPPCAFVPCIVPCDASERGVVHATYAAPRRYGGSGSTRRIYCRIPEGVGPGQMLATTTPDGHRVSFIVPRAVAPGTQIQLEC